MADSQACAPARVTDAQLLLEISVGNLEALESLYDRYALFCWHVAGRHCANKDRAAAAVETAFLRVWRDPPLDVAYPLRRHLAELIHRSART